jgi:hypothetical protein
MSNVDLLPPTPTQFRPDTHHRTVRAVLEDPKLSSDEKRAVLSAWASDMYAVESAPSLRMIPGHAAPLRLSEILSALRSLDDDDPPPRGGAVKRASAESIRTDLDDDTGAAPVAHRLVRLRQAADLRTAKMRAHRDNVRRYKRILASGLTDLERQFVTRRLAEEQSAIRALANASGGANVNFSFAAGY